MSLDPSASNQLAVTITSDLLIRTIRLNSDKTKKKLRKVGLDLPKFETIVFPMRHGRVVPSDLARVDSETATKALEAHAAMVSEFITPWTPV